jgi:hypothetical protein
MKPLAIDLYCGLGGWSEGLLAEGYRVVGFDVERHVYGEHCYPAQLVLARRADDSRTAVQRRRADRRQSTVPGIQLHGNAVVDCETEGG